MKNYRGTLQPAGADDGFMAPLIDLMQQRLPSDVDLPAVLGLFLVMIELSRTTGTFTLLALQEVVGPLDQIRVHIDALERSGFISIRDDDGGSSHENGVVMISDRGLPEAWQEVRKPL
ncbi:hypothetical protein [Rhizobium sp. NFR03]|uniref:hypothetical protein n=1 Tax=Rhizobium sp. NFR03 TaxID=1566263 RepID=UPI0008B51C64|nr:hypothetical protein [Rhizobium sp. NFR03]SES41333.1 hypothetical protein SAMN03159406_04159 [Rhizobium sp. NFR03]